jgi:Fe-S-cluster containining protein
MFNGFSFHYYRHWLSANHAPTWIKEAIPQSESNPGAFNCADCFMVKPHGLTRDLGPFDPALKCCTYHPFLPNFTVGALLIEADAGRLFPELLERYLMESRLTPIGAFSLRDATSVCETGKRSHDQCSFLKEGRCSIHSFRPSTCATYICRSNYGDAGLRAWRTFEERLAKFEWSLAHEAAFEIGYTKNELENAYPSIEAATVDYRSAYKVAQLTSVLDWDE